jgi:IS5 family transposase
MIINSLSYHRNGSAGAGYYLARLTWRGDGKKYTGTAIIFDAAEHVAVNADDGTGFRCEDFEAELRAFIESDAGQQMTWPPRVA